MEAAAWNLVKDLVAEALARPPGERDAFIEEHCTDQSLRDEIRSLLLASEDMSTNFLEPVIPPAGADDRELPLGGRIGPYLILDTLARGGMGQVYLGKDLRLHRQVALKSLLSSAESSATERGRVLREARAAAQINHANVATIHDIIEHDERALIVMEYVPGESLAALLRRERLPVGRVIALGRQIAAGLVAAHAKGVIHRDLKPANIQLTPSGEAKILDFGVARTTVPFTTTAGSTGSDEARGDRQPGTPGYMSPEQMLSRHVDERSDIFSLGVVLFEMATGERTFQVRGDEELVKALHRTVRRADVVDPSVPHALADVIARTLEINPAARFQSATALAEALEQVQLELATRNSHSGTGVATTWTPSRGRTAVRFAAAAGLTIAALPTLGYLTTAAFNLTVGRIAPFNRESPAVWLELGVRSLVTPAVFIGAMLLTLWTIAFAGRLARLAPPVERLSRRVGLQRRRLISRLRLDEPHVFAQAAVTAGALTLAGILLGFSKLLSALTTYTISSVDSPAIFLPLQPGHSGALYRFELDVVVLGLAAALVQMRRLRAANIGAPPGSLAAIVALLSLTILLSVAPYRLLWKNEAERIDNAGQRCYVLGQEGDQALVFCPDQPPPRNRVIPLNSPAVRRPGLPPESIFTPPASR